MATIFDPIQLPNSQTNIIDNGGMEIWQRGVSFNNPTSYTADRWGISTSCTTYSIAQETATANVDSGAASMKLTITTAAGGVFRIGQPPENPAQYVGKTMSYSARVKSNIAGVKLFVSYIGGQTASTIAHTGDNTWQTISMTMVMPNAGLTFSIGFDSVNTTVGTSVSPSNGIFYVDGVSMVAGVNPPVYIPIPLQQDLARCQRFFWSTPAVANMVLFQGHVRNTTGASYVVRFPVTMRIGPTLTVNNPTNFATWNAGGGNLAVTTLVNSGAPANTDTFFLEATVASGLVAGNSTILLTTNANAQIFFSADF